MATVGTATTTKTTNTWMTRIKRCRREHHCCDQIVSTQQRCESIKHVCTRPQRRAAVPKVSPTRSQFGLVLSSLTTLKLNKDLVPTAPHHRTTLSNPVIHNPIHLGYMPSMCQQMDRKPHHADCVAADSAMLLLSKGQDLQSLRGHLNYEHYGWFYYIMISMFKNRWTHPD